MWRIPDVSHEVGRIVISAWREGIVAGAMFVDSFQSDEKPVDLSRYQRTVIFIPGFIARPSYYYRLKYFFISNNVGFISPHNLIRNTLSWRQARAFISDSIKKVEDETGTVPDLMGHSKGCVDAAGVLAKHPEIEHVFFLAGPWRGTSLNALSFMIDLINGRCGRPLDPDFFEDKTLLRKITNIFSSADALVPPYEAKLEGVKKEIFMRNGSLWKDFANGHTGLPFSARHDILRAISLRQAA